MKLAVIALTAAAVAGCTTLPASVATIETEIQADASSLCQFEPTLATVAQIVTSLFPGAAAVEAIVQPVAQQICTAVVNAPIPASGKFGAAVVYYPGTTIPIHGTFLASRRYRR